MSFNWEDFDGQVHSVSIVFYEEERASMHFNLAKDHPILALPLLKAVKEVTFHRFLTTTGVV